MKCKVIMGIMLTLLLIGMLTLAFNIQPVKSEPTHIQWFQYGSGVGVGSGPSNQTSITLTSAPISGDVLIAVIGAQGEFTTPPGEPFIPFRVSSIRQTGVTWTCQVNSTNRNFDIDVETWLGVVGVGASRSIIVDLNGSLSNILMAVTIDVCEYKGVVTTSPLDKTATNSGFGSADTGTTSKTTQPNELWIGAILVESSVPQASPTNGFVLLDGQPNATGGRISTAYLEKIVNATGTANTGTGGWYAWAGCIATFFDATTVGGMSIPVNKLELLAPYIGLTTLLAAALITVGYVKKKK